MAVADPEVVNGWYVGTRYNSLGSSHLNPSEMQISNAYKFKAEMNSYGFSDLAVAGMLGNIQTESGINPGAIQKWSVLPNNAESLSDVPNSVMLGYYDHSNPNNKGYGVGFIQWDSYTTTAPAGCTIASFAERYSYLWYDGSCQCFRLKREEELNLSWTQETWDGVKWTWAKFKTIEGHTPSIAADIFRSCRERSSGDPTGNQNRRDNAEFWYQYFIDHPIGPGTRKKLFLFLFNRRKELKPRCQRM